MGCQDISIVSRLRAAAKDTNYETDNTLWLRWIISIIMYNGTREGNVRLWMRARSPTYYVSHLPICQLIKVFTLLNKLECIDVINKKWYFKNIFYNYLYKTKPQTLIFAVVFFFQHWCKKVDIFHFDGSFILAKETSIMRKIVK